MDSFNTTISVELAYAWEANEHAPYLVEDCRTFGSKVKLAKATGGEN